MSPGKRDPNRIVSGRTAAAVAAILLLGGVGVWLADKPWVASVADRLWAANQSFANSNAEASEPVVAVLPFDNLSGDETQTYFVDGLTEDIIADLASYRDVMVIARNSTFAFKDQPTCHRLMNSP